MFLSFWRKNKMTEECNKGSCEQESQSQCGSKGSGCEMTDMMMHLADQAWSQLMIEKMKAEFEKVRGEKMSKIAAASIEVSIDKWEHKMGGKMKCQEGKDKLKAAFMG